MDGVEPRDDTVDPWEFHGRWPVRLYELDSNGHVNNAVYLNYAEQVALEHIEASTPAGHRYSLRNPAMGMACGKGTEAVPKSGIKGLVRRIGGTLF